MEFTITNEKSTKLFLNTLETISGSDQFDTLRLHFDSNGLLIRNFSVTRTIQLEIFYGSGCFDIIPTDKITVDVLPMHLKRAIYSAKKELSNFTGLNIIINYPEITFKTLGTEIEHKITCVNLNSRLHKIARAKLTSSASDIDIEDIKMAYDVIEHITAEDSLVYLSLSENKLKMSAKSETGQVKKEIKCNNSNIEIKTMVLKDSFKFVRNLIESAATVEMFMENEGVVKVLPDFDHDITCEIYIAAALESI